MHVSLSSLFFLLCFIVVVVVVGALGALVRCSFLVISLEWLQLELENGSIVIFVALAVVVTIELVAHDASLCVLRLCDGEICLCNGNDVF